MSQPNRVLAAKNVKAKRERREFAHCEMTKSVYLTPKFQPLPIADVGAIEYVNGRSVTKYPTGLTRRKVLRQHF